jgi:hypothetical protein
MLLSKNHHFSSKMAQKHRHALYFGLKRVPQAATAPIATAKHTHCQAATARPNQKQPSTIKKQPFLIKTPPFPIKKATFPIKKR